MANISFDLTTFNTYIQKENININDKDIESLNTIFKECDVTNEQGESVSDNKLTGDEIRTFQQKLSASLRNLVDRFWRATNEEYAAEAGALQEEAGNNVQADNSVHEVECTQSKEYQQKFRDVFEKSKEILLKEENIKLLGLTQEEVEYIKNADIESVDKGAGRYAKKKVLMNINSGMPEVTLTEGNMIKLLLHECTHACKKSQNNTQSEERSCEGGAITKACMLLKNGEISDSVFYQIQANGQIIKLSDFIDGNNNINEEKLNRFINLWMIECDYTKLPES